MTFESEDFLKNINDELLFGTKDNIIDVEHEETTDKPKKQLTKKHKIIVSSIVVAIALTAGFSYHKINQQAVTPNPELDAVLNKTIKAPIGSEPVLASSSVTATESVINPGSGNIITEHNLALKNEEVLSHSYNVKPVVNQPVVNQPVVNQPVVNQPVVSQPVVNPVVKLDAKTDQNLIKIAEQNKMIAELQAKLSAKEATKELSKPFSKPIELKKTNKNISMQFYGIEAITKNSIIISKNDEDTEFMIGDTISGLGKILKINVNDKTVETTHFVYHLTK